MAVQIAACPLEAPCVAVHVLAGARLGPVMMAADSLEQEGGPAVYVCQHTRHAHDRNLLGIDRLLVRQHQRWCAVPESTTERNA